MNFDNIDETELKEVIEESMLKLSPRERDILRLRFGLDDNRMRTLEELGQLFIATTEVIHSEEARIYNDYNFNRIPAKPVMFQAVDTFYEKYTFDISKSCRADKELLLKVDARVILLINLNFEKGLINGSCGNIKEIGEDYILVKFDNGQVAEIEKHNFEFYRDKKLIAERKQFPLQLAYGITIHKSQGMTLDKLVVDCSRIFEKGQLYVALSRIRTLDGLYLINFDPNKIKVDEKVVEFYDKICT